MIQEQKYNIVLNKQVKLSKLEQLKQKVGRFLSLHHITVPDYHHALVMEFKRFSKVLEPGQHSYNFFTEQITIVPDIFIEEDTYGIKTINKQFDCILQPGQYFVNSALNEHVDVYHVSIVPENHKGVLTQYGKFVKVLEPGKYIVNDFLQEKLKLEKLQLIPENYKGIVTTYGKFTRVLESGEHFVNTFLQEELKLQKLQAVPENHKGIVTIFGKFARILEPGEHFVNPILGEEMKINAESIIEDDEQGLFIVDGQFKQVLLPGKWFANPLLNEKIIKQKLTVIEEGHVGIKMIRGVFEAQLLPGIYFQNPYLFEKITLVNMQLLTKELKPVTIMTKDTVNIPAVKSILVYQITDARKAICDVEDIDFAIRETIKTIMHQVISEHTLDSIMCNKVQISNSIKERVATNSENWGIRIERIDIKDIEFSEELKEAMSASARAQRVADSKLITARAEVEAAALFRQAADQLNTEAAMQMRQLDALVQICKGPNTRVLFIPDMNHLNGKNNASLMDRVIAKQINIQE